MGFLENGKWRDPVLTIEALARNQKMISESAIQEAMNTHAKYFRQVGPDRA